MLASQKGHEEVVDKLLQRGATVDMQKMVHYNIPQMFVSHWELTEKVFNFITYIIIRCISVYFSSTI